MFAESSSLDRKTITAPSFPGHEPKREPGPAAAREWGGSLVEHVITKERADVLAGWRNVLVPGECNIMRDPENGEIKASRGDLTVDVTELVATGSSIVRRRPDGDQLWTAKGFIPPRNEGLPSRLVITREDGGTTNIGLDKLMTAPDDNDKSWEIPIPTE